MADHTIKALFETYDEAARAVRRLETSGIPNVEISLVTNNFDDAYSRFATQAADRERENPSSELAGAGAAAGTVLGGGAGLLAGLGIAAIPGFGPIVAAGWLMATLVGAGAGAAAGGLAGALVGAGLGEEEAHTYAEGIRRGGVLVLVRTDEAAMDRVIDILDDEGRVNMGKSEQAWRSEGWAPPIGAAASTTTGLTTDLMPNPLDEDSTQGDVEDERLRHLTGRDRDPE